MECFTTLSEEIEGRLDPHFYRPEFIKLVNKLEKLKCKSIGEISSDLKNGSTPPGGIFEKQGIPYFRSQDFNLFDFEINQYIKEEFHNKLKRSAIKPKDVLLAVVGATLGVVGYVPNDIKEGNINQNVVRIRTNDKGVNPKFLAIILSSGIGKKLILRNATIQAQAYLNNSQLADIKVPVPSLEKQDKIIQLIDKAYSLKKFHEAEAQQLLDSVNGYILAELGIKIPELNDKMCYSVNSEEIENNRCDAYYYQPKFDEAEKAIKKGKYEVKKLKEFITMIHYGASVKNDYIKEEGIPFLRILNLKPNKIELENVVNLPETMRKELGNAFVKEGDLLISRSGTVGVISVVPKEAEGYAFGSFMIKFCLGKEINGEYVSIWLNTKIQQFFTEREKIGAIQGNITIGTIENFKLPIPPLAVQDKIAEEAKARIKKAEQLQKEAKEELEMAKRETEQLILSEAE